MTYTQDCIQSFGNNVVGVKGNDNNSSCDCASGYAWNSQHTGCETVKNTSNVNNSINDSNPEPQKSLSCKNDLTLSFKKDKCIKVPENAHIVDSPTDLWLCNDGYKETGNKCVLIDNLNQQQNQSQEQVKTNDTTPKPSKNIFVKIKNFFNSLFENKNK